MFGNEYFVTIYAFNDPIADLPAQSHSFAEFIAAEPGRVTERISISWLPSDFGTTLRLPKVIRVPGRNYSREETMDFARRLGVAITTFGPFASSQELYFRAKTRRAQIAGSRR